MESGRQIGNVPAMNLLRLSPGVIVRFAGRHWCVRHIRADHIDVEPSRSAGGVEISYGGTAARMDPAIVEEMLRLLDAGIDNPAMAMEASRTFRAAAERMSRHVAWDRVPLARDGQGHYHYFTFRGRLLNSVIARWAALDAFDAGDVVLRTGRRLDLSALPGDPRALEDAAAAALQLPDDLTVFQSLLPPEVLLRELGDVWLKTAVHGRSLERLRQAQITPAPLEDLVPLCE
jgi:hypothetical protein